MRYLTIFLLVLTVNVCEAQQHLSFLGIPIDGNIKSFNQKLIAKGFKPDLQHNKIGEDTWWYTGIFAGRKCNLTVSLTTTTKTVYSVDVDFDCYAEIFAQYFKNEDENTIMYKYTKEQVLYEFDDKKHTYVYFKKFKEDTEVDEDKTFGNISLTYWEKDYYSEKPFTYNISFEDRINYLKYKKEQNDDL